MKIGLLQRRMLDELRERGQSGAAGIRQVRAARSLHAAGLAKFVETSSYLYVRKGNGASAYYKREWFPQGHLRPNTHEG